MLLDHIQTKPFLITYLTNLLELSMFVKKHTIAKISIKVTKHYDAWPENAFSSLLDWRRAYGRGLTLSKYIPITCPASKVSQMISQNYEQVKLNLEEALQEKKVIEQDYFQLNVRRSEVQDNMMPPLLYAMDRRDI